MEEQLRKKSFTAGFGLSRTGTDGSFFVGLARRSTNASSVSPTASSIELDKEKGPLGLTTVYEPQPPAQPIVDLIFVHGLGGGSRKTWSFSADPTHYWPQAWLPDDDNFAGSVRIHVFGYNADWNWNAPRHTVLNIDDFGQLLLGELRNHLSIRKANTRIILVGHSMGGCVAKKTYILACQDPSASDIAKRFHSMFFLATPHRGSDMATLLQNMLSVTLGKKQFVKDLTPNSDRLAAINDAFRHVAQNLRLWSFYETLRMGNRLVVDKESATMGYHNEEIAAMMNADHRQVCKFKTPNDPNYKMLRNALVTAIDLIRATAAGDTAIPSGVPTKHRETPLSRPSSLSLTNAISCLRDFLAPPDAAEGDLAMLQALKQPESCHWFTEQLCYKSWKHGDGPSVLWLTGRPATGKSVLASHVIDDLRQSSYGFCCSYFIFKNSKGKESTLSECFRSLAFQMAIQDTLVITALLELAHQGGPGWDQIDEVGVWRRLFVGCIFKLPFEALRRHCWVLDGAEECARFSAIFSKRILVTLPQNLRLFATSRPVEEIERGLATLRPDQACRRVLTEEDTFDDMHRFVKSQLAELGRPERADDREAMTARILEKSSGSFLWTRLVLQEFETAWTEEAMDHILNEIPVGLFDLYARMVRMVEADRRKLALARPILTWVALAFRPLTVDEIRCAVKYDIGQTLQNVAKAVPDLCGQFVFVDDDGRVHLIHETAREFLTAVAKDYGLDLFVDKKEGHSKLASILLRYLSGAVLRSMPQTKASRGDGWRPRRGFAKLLAAAESTSIDPSLLDYSCKFFSEHMYRATSEKDDLMNDLQTFLTSNNLLYWVEHIAKSGDLTDLTLAAMSLRGYYSRRLKYVAPADRSMQLLDGWVADLIRVSAKFRTQLSACPSSIHYLIPPLCPSESTISQAFSAKIDRLSPAAANKLVVKGLPTGPWDDCLTRVDFHLGQATAVSYGGRFFAIGLSTGHISIYESSSIRGVQQMHHPERVKILLFSPDLDDAYLVSCGTKHLALWSPESGSMIYSFQLPSPPLAVTFMGSDELICALQSGEMIKWDIMTGDTDSVSWLEGHHAADREQGTIPTQAPSCAAFLVRDDRVLLAVGYRSHPIFVWDALELELIGICQPSFYNNGINDLVFSPDPEIPVLLVSFQDGSLCVFDYTTMELHHHRPDVFAQSLAFSSDGRTLAAGKSQGLVEVYEVEEAHIGRSTTLGLMYRTKHPPDQRIQGVSISPDGRRFVDVRGRQGRVWAPAALVRKIDTESESSIASNANILSTAPPPAAAGMIQIIEDPEITTQLAVSYDKEQCVLAGRSNGDVVFFRVASPTQACVLYRHGHNSSVVSIALSTSGNLVATADDSGRVLVVQVPGPLSSIGPQKPITRLDRRFGGSVAKVLLSPVTESVLVCGLREEKVWQIPAETTLNAGEAQQANSTGPPRPSSIHDESFDGILSSRSAFQHPINPGWYVVVVDDTARVYSWVDAAELSRANGIQLVRNPTRDAQEDLDDKVSKMTSISTYHVGPGFVVEHTKASSLSRSCLYMWPASAFDPSRSADIAYPAVEPNLTNIGHVVFKVLGIAGLSAVLFLDVNLWVCSVELQSVGASDVTLDQRVLGDKPECPLSIPFSSQRQPSTAHARRHFFALNEWRNTGGDLFGALVTSSTTATPARSVNRTRNDVVFSHRHGIVVIEGGLEFSESVVLSASASWDNRGPHRHHSLPEPSGSALNEAGTITGWHTWDVVAGSMHRRSSNW